MFQEISLIKTLSAKYKRNINEINLFKWCEIVSTWCKFP